MGLADYKYLIETETAFTTAAYSTDAISHAQTTPALNRNGQFGLHLVVTTAFTGLASGLYLWIIHGAATAPTTKHSCLFIPVAAMTAGAHFFVPAGIGVDLLQFMRARYEPVSEAATAGAVTAWFGPADGTP